MHDKHRTIEEPCNGKLLRTVLKTNGIGDNLVEFNSNRRRDWFWELAHKLTDKFDILCFETLNLKGMQRLWGRKISDACFGEFLQILEWVAKKKHKQLVFVDQWYPSTKTCSSCGHVLGSLELSVREWRCPSCQSVNGRDENASRNICAVGASTVGLGDVSRFETAIAV